MSRRGCHEEVEEAIKTCDEALEKAFLATRNFCAKNPQAGIITEEVCVVSKEEIEKIKEILKRITITSMPF